MGPLLLILLLALILGGAGFAANILWYAAVFLLVMWVIGFAVRPNGGRWYYW